MKAFTRGRSLRDVGGQPPDPDEARGEPGAGDVLHDLDDRLPLPEGVEERRHGPEVEGVGAQPEEMGRDPLEFGEDDPQVLGPLGYLDAEELLHRQAVGEVVGETARVVQPVRQGQRLGVGHGLGKLLHPPVEVADMRHGLDDDLSVQLQNQPAAPHALRDAGVPC